MSKNRKIMVISPNSVNPDYRISKSVIMLSRFGEVILVKCLKNNEIDRYGDTQPFTTVALRPSKTIAPKKKKVIQAIKKFMKFK